MEVTFCWLLPIVGMGNVCRLPRTDRSERTADFKNLFAGTAVDRQRLPDGVRWTLKAGPDTEAESRRLAALEERCCDGISFEVERESERVIWNIRGPKTADALLDAFHELPVLVGTAEGASRLWETLDGGACGPTRNT